MLTLTHRLSSHLHIVMRASVPAKMDLVQFWGRYYWAMARFQREERRRAVLLHSGWLLLP